VPCLSAAGPELYAAFMDDNGDWFRPVNLGTAINSRRQTPLLDKVCEDDGDRMYGIDIKYAVQLRK
jgi:hypothetical protein